MRIPPIRFAIFLVLAAPAWGQGTSDCDAGEVYDDGLVDGQTPVPGALSSTQTHYVSPFTPASYPCDYDEVCLYLFSHGPVAAATFAVVVYDDDGAGGTPGTLLAEAAHTVDSVSGWVTVPLAAPVTVVDGSIWIGMRWRPFPDNGLSLGMDFGAMHPFSYSPDGVFWTTYESIPGNERTLMVRANGKPVAANARATFRNGSLVNPACYVSAPPVIGSEWTGQVAHASDPLTTFTQIHFRLRPATGPVTRIGELLLDLTSARLLVTTVIPSSVALDVHQRPIPNDTSLAGIRLSTQALVGRADGLALCNAYDLVVGY